MSLDKIKLNTKESNPVFAEENLSKIPAAGSLFLFSIKDFLYWWYVQMPAFHLKTLGRVSDVMLDKLSIPILLSNFFVPWKRDKSPVGYFIGITVKLSFLPISIFVYLLVVLAYILFILFWVCVPIMTIFFIFATFFI